MGWRQSFIFSLIGAILFSLLIVYDTYLISKRLSPDEVRVPWFENRKGITHCIYRRTIHL